MGQRVRDRLPPPVDGGSQVVRGNVGARIYQAAPRDPETKGVVERANGFLETSFMPGRSFASPGDYNTQLAGWLPKANTRILRRTGQQPGIRIVEDAARDDSAFKKFTYDSDVNATKTLGRKGSSRPGPELDLPATGPEDRG